MQPALAVGVEQQCWPVGHAPDAILMIEQVLLSPVLRVTLPVASQAPVNRWVMKPGDVCVSVTVWLPGVRTSQPVSPPEIGPATLLPSTETLYDKLTVPVLKMNTFNCGTPVSVSDWPVAVQLPEAGLQTQKVRLSLGFMMRLPLVKLKPLITMAFDHDAVLRATRSVLREF